VASEVHRVQHVVDARRVGMRVVHQRDEQHRQPPFAHQRELQVVQVDAEQPLLQVAAPRGGRLRAHLAEVQRQRGRQGPQQQFADVVQQRGDADLLDRHVLPPRGDGAREIRGAARALGDAQEPDQRARVLRQHLLDRRRCGDQRVRAVEALQHHQAFHRRRVAFGTVRREAGKQPRRGERIAEHDIREVARTGGVGLVQFGHPARGGAQHREFRGAHVGHPPGQVGRGPVDQRGIGGGRGHVGDFGRFLRKLRGLET